MRGGDGSVIVSWGEQRSVVCKDAPGGLKGEEKTRASCRLRRGQVTRGRTAPQARWPGLGEATASLTPLLQAPLQRKANTEAFQDPAQGRGFQRRAGFTLPLPRPPRHLLPQSSPGTAFPVGPAPLPLPDVHQLISPPPAPLVLGDSPVVPGPDAQAMSQRHRPLLPGPGQPQSQGSRQKSQPSLGGESTGTDTPHQAHPGSFGS